MKGQRAWAPSMWLDSEDLGSLLGAKFWKHVRFTDTFKTSRSRRSYTWQGVKPSRASPIQPNSSANGGLETKSYYANLYIYNINICIYIYLLDARYMHHIPNLLLFDPYINSQSFCTNWWKLLDVICFLAQVLLMIVLEPVLWAASLRWEGLTTIKALVCSFCLETSLWNRT